MRMFDIMLFLALLGAVSGAVDGLMLSTTDNWFSEYTTPDMSTVDIDTDDRFNSQSLVSDDDEKVPSVGWSMVIGAVTGIFAITFVIGNIFYVPNATGGNMLAPFLVVIQVGIWIIYAWGIMQFISGKSIKGME